MIHLWDGDGMHLLFVLCSIRWFSLTLYRDILWKLKCTVVELWLPFPTVYLLKCTCIGECELLS